jgi:hypothetical protein
MLDRPGGFRAMRITMMSTKRQRQWTELAECTKGTAYGHVPGHQYHDVTATISHNGTQHRVEVLEVWGSAQGYDQEHGRNRIVAIDADLDTAVRTANARARQADIRVDYMIQALSGAHADALDAGEEESVDTTERVTWNDWMRAPGDEAIKAVLNDDAASDWLRQALWGALERDAIDAANDAEVLARLLRERADAVLKRDPFRLKQC